MLPKIINTVVEEHEGAQKMEEAMVGLQQQRWISKQHLLPPHC